MMRALAILGVLLAFATVAGIVLADDDAMATCQLTHSFGVCHDALR